MALFQKKPMAGSSVPLYTLGLSKTVLLIGLGNPGKEYDGTRHNIGFACLDEFARKNEFPAWVAKKDLKCLVSNTTIGTARVIAMKPTTFMNLSGQAVQAVQHFYKVPAEQILVIHDEIDIPFGQIRTRNGGGSAGHNGIKSLIEHIGDTFNRVRVGIQNEQTTQIESSDFVLQKFSKQEASQLPNLTNETVSIITEYIYGGQLNNETRSFLLS